MNLTTFAGWENFYVIVGSSAGALIGLQFVVMTLVAEKIKPSPKTTDAFATPSVIHFAVVLLLSALLSAPWHGIVVVALLWGFVGLGGIAYTVVVARRLRKQTQYKPVLEDWLCHVHIPLAAYAILGRISPCCSLLFAHYSLLRRSCRAVAAVCRNSQRLGRCYLRDCSWTPGEQSQGVVLVEVL